MANPTRLPRKKLYELVWSKPMRQLSKEFDLSDVGLAKICKKHNIPCPERGYWAKLEHGKPTQKTPLPDEDNNDQIIIGVSATLNKKIRPVSHSQQIKLIRKKYPICENLRGCHPLIKDIKNRVWRENYRYPTLFFPDGIEKKRIMVTKASKDRALRFLNSLFYYLEAIGHEIKMYQQKHDYYDRKDKTPNIIIRGQEIEFVIREKMIQYEKQREHQWESKHSYRASGKLTFEIDSHSATRRIWSDGKKYRLEEYLYDIILNLLMTVRKMNDSDRKAWREEELRIENEKRYMEEEKRRQIELERIQRLESEAANWRKSKEIREYLKASESSICVLHGEYDVGSEYDLWLRWAYAYADRIDPLTKL